VVTASSVAYFDLFGHGRLAGLVPASNALTCPDDIFGKRKVQAGVSLDTSWALDRQTSTDRAQDLSARPLSRLKIVAAWHQQRCTELNALRAGSTHSHPWTADDADHASRLNLVS